MIHKTIEEREHYRRQIYQHIKNLFQVEDMRGVEVYSSLARVAQLGILLDSQRYEGKEISSPRWQLLLRLFIAEQKGNPNGLTPTELSHYQQVSKNTISSLLRGLEEQGFIQREMDPKDLRIFRIHLTEAGRQIILKTAPGRIESLNEMLSGLSDEEIEQLIGLLNKLRRVLEIHFCRLHTDPTDRCESLSTDA